VDDLASRSDRATEGKPAARGAVLEPASVAERRRRAEGERRVTIRSAPDTMCRISALLPARDGVAAYAALKQAADTAEAAGDPRSRGQVMADTFTDRVTGRPRHAAADPVKVTLNVVVPDAVLFGEPAEPEAQFGVQGLADTVGAWLDGYGPVPADLVREWVAEAGAQVRRLYADRAGRLVAMESTQRRFRRCGS